MESGKGSVIDYRVPPEQFTPLARFDGSVIAERTADPDERVLSDEDLEQAVKEGEQKDQGG